MNKDEKLAREAGIKLNIKVSGSSCNGLLMAFLFVARHSGSAHGRV